ncbi:MAG: exodeoxyribonuclease III [Alphaproteobacteria bacterium]|nr:exodeoxyribonuclease III [Alphaproteobacteria bacterium]
MRIAAFNVNSIRARLPNVLDWLREARPDIALLQETKTEDHNFPALEIGDLGYNLALHGQRTYNGVAILSRFPLEDVTRALPGVAADEGARYLEAVSGGVRVASVYVPQGTDLASDRFAAKLAFLDRLYDRARALLAYEEAFVLGGDYNVAPEPADVYDPEKLAGTLCYHPEERARFRKLEWLGLTDAFRALHPEPARYSYWDYRARYWKANEGLRIDHLLLSPQAADRLSGCDIDAAPRARPNPSDHGPVWCDLADAT